MEYQNAMDIVLRCLLGWDSKKQSGRCGIFGMVEAWIRADEEQGRLTLHGHWLIWIRGFNRLRSLMQDRDRETRKAATRKYIDYINSIMSTSLGDFEVMIRHDCMSVDGKASCVLKEEPLQVLRDCRSQSLCKDLGGRVMRCNQCKKAVSSDDVLTMALDYFWRKQVGLISLTICIHSKQPTLLTLTYYKTPESDVADESESLGILQQVLQGSYEETRKV